LFAQFYSSCSPTLA
jgi:hypothetical protein